MKLRFSPFVFLLLVFAFSTTDSHAQATVYGGVAVVNYCLDLGNNDFSCKDDTVGFTGGASYLFPRSSPWKLGIDGRFDESPGDKGGKAGLFAAKVAYVPRSHAVSTYFQVGGGVISTPYSTTSCVGNGFSYTCSTAQAKKSGGAVELAVGISLHPGKHLYVRPVEVMEAVGSGVGHVNIGAALGCTF